METTKRQRLEARRAELTAKRNARKHLNTVLSSYRRAVYTPTKGTI